MPSYTEFVDMVEMGDPIYLKCEDCGGTGLPPRKACPDCGSRHTVEKELPKTGEVATFTEIHVPTPMFQGDAPFTVVVAEFEDVDLRLTGQLRDADGDEIQIGDEVEVGAEEHDEVDRVITFTA